MTLSHAPSMKPSGGHSWILVLLSAVCLLWPKNVAGQTPQSNSPPDVLHQLSDSIEALVQQVSPSVVQMQVTGYGPTEESGRGQTSLVIVRRQAISSGVIVDCAYRKLHSAVFNPK